jgi:hypothetical protein
MTRACLVGVLLGLAACGSRSAPEPVQAPPATIVIDTDPFDVAPGDEVLMCTVTDQVLTEPFDVATIHGYQMKGGHHAALFYSTKPLSPAPTHRCVEHESMDWQLLGAGAEGEPVGLRLPDGVAVRIPAGARLMVESHYVNASHEVMHVRDRVTAESFGDRPVLAYAGTFQVTDFEMAVPPFTRETRVIECTLDGDMNAIDLNGHAHQWATHVAVTLARAGSDTFDTLYERDWEPAFQFHPPTIGFPLDAPLALHRDDRVRVTCTWENTTDRALRFPTEMCIGTMHYVPDRGYLRCGTAVSTTDS